MLAFAARGPRHHQRQAFDLAERDVAAFAHELAGVLTLQHGGVEHPRCADEIDPVGGEIVIPPGFVPLEHARPQTRPSPHFRGDAPQIKHSRRRLVERMQAVGENVPAFA